MQSKRNKAGNELFEARNRKLKLEKKVIYSLEVEY